jgi:hypothetical protein
MAMYIGTNDMSIKYSYHIILEIKGSKNIETVINGH